jgi:hypothetical protein
MRKQRFFWAVLCLGVCFLDACGDDSEGVTKCTGGGCPDGNCDNDGAKVCALDWSSEDPCFENSGENDFCLEFNGDEYAVQCGASGNQMTNCSATGRECDTAMQRGVWVSDCDDVQEINDANDDEDDTGDDIPIQDTVTECWGGCPSSQECGGDRNVSCGFDWSEALACDASLAASGAYCVTYGENTYAVQCAQGASVTNCTALGETCFVDNMEGSGWYSMCFDSEGSSSGFSNVMSCDGECAFEGNTCGYEVDQSICTASWSVDEPCAGNATGSSCVKTYSGTYAVNCGGGDAYVECVWPEQCALDGGSYCYTP